MIENMEARIVQPLLKMGQQRRGRGSQHMRLRFARYAGEEGLIAHLSFPKIISGRIGDAAQRN